MAKTKKRKNLSQGWLMTFTDMLMLLVVMFVLFLSFSEVDSDSFKRNAGPIAEAFNQPPPTSILPGQSAIIDLSITNIDLDTMGKTVGFDQSELITNELQEEELQEEELQEEELQGERQKSNEKEATENQPFVEEENNLSKNIEELMEKEIQAGKFEVVTKQNIVTLRFPEKVTFASGDASLQADIQPILDQITRIITNVGKHDKIIVTGHTDSVPISNYKYRSNWDLSAARAVSVVHRILKNKNIDKSRLIAIGSADVNPIADNDTADNRALNRRVEIRIETSEL